MKMFPARLLAGLFVFTVTTAQSAAQSAAPIVSIETFCERIAKRLKSVPAQSCRDAQLLVGEGASHRGLPLLYRDFAPGRSRRTPYRVLLIGGIHGDELSSVSIVFQWMKKLERERLQPFHWRVIPLSNPDGLFAPKASRTNARGVDLNRNFPTSDWKADAHAYWKRVARGDARRFPGPSAMSEPETRWLTAQIKAFKPDAVISVHAPFGILDFDGPLTPPQRFGYLRLQPLGVYPGSLGNFAGITLGLPTITLELPNANTMPSVSQSQRVWADMLTWLEKNLPKSGASSTEVLRSEP